MRVALYVDGNNLFWGLEDAGLQSYQWIDVPQLGRVLLRPDQQLVYTRYFTTRFSSHSTSEQIRRAQKRYIEALATRADLEIINGRYKISTERCLNCGHSWPTWHEKRTDVNIAIQLVIDAFRDRYDSALLISGDSDLVPPIEAITELFPEKRVIAAFPPKRYSDELKQAATGFIHISRNELLNSQLPDRVRLPNGYVVERPEEWR